jgi:glucokinase
MNKKELVAGIDIGGTKTALGLIDQQGKIYASTHFSTEDFPNVEDYVEELSNQIEVLFGAFKKDYSLIGIGIGAPNGNFYHGAIEHAPNLAWKGIIPLADMVSKRVNHHVLLTNDAKAAAIGEMIFGGAKGMKNFIEVTVGTGLGSGFVANGELIYGNYGLAGELGHVNVIRDGRLCSCGRKGCLEAYVSKRGMIQTYQELSNQNSNDVSPATIADLANKSDKIALKTFDETGKILGQTLADIVCITEPEAIFIFGGIALAGDLLLNPIRHYMELNLHHIYKGKVKIIPSALPDNTAAILGAAALIWNNG